MQFLNVFLSMEAGRFLRNAINYVVFEFQIYEILCNYCEEDFLIACGSGFYLFSFSYFCENRIIL